jgi:NAD(P)-dependent dehydrogenase (short-subunit alcohol dehydrogenase family)
MARGDRGGSIITITSIEAHRAAPGYAVYGAMKAAVTHLTRTLAVELGGSGIRINCVAPDFIPTAGLAGVAGRAGSAGQRAAAAGDASDPGDWLTIPLKRKGEETDVGNCVLFLASDLSAYITGTTLHPDGGALAASGWMDWPDDGFTARPPTWVLDRLERPDL